MRSQFDFAKRAFAECLAQNVVADSICIVAPAASAASTPRLTGPIALRLLLLRSC